LFPSAALTEPQTRSLQFTETIRVKVPNGGKQLRIWVPVPAQDAFQTTEILKVEAPFSYQETRDKDFKNRTLFFQSQSSSEPVQIRLTYRIVRKEQGAEPAQRGDPAVKNYLQPRGLEAPND